MSFTQIKTSTIVASHSLDINNSGRVYLPLGRRVYPPLEIGKKAEDFCVDLERRVRDGDRVHDMNFINNVDLRFAGLV